MQSCSTRGFPFVESTRAVILRSTRSLCRQWSCSTRRSDIVVEDLAITANEAPCKTVAGRSVARSTAREDIRFPVPVQETIQRAITDVSRIRNRYGFNWTTWRCRGQGRIDSLHTLGTPRVVVPTTSRRVPPRTTGIGESSCGHTLGR